MDVGLNFVFQTGTSLSRKKWPSSGNFGKSWERRVEEIEGGKTKGGGETGEVYCEGYSLFGFEIKQR